MTVPSKGRRTRLRRMWLRAILLAGSVTIAVAFLLALTLPTTVIPPAAPLDPALVFLVDLGQTPILILTIGEDRMVGYVYGDWNYYALQNRSMFDGIAALLWPTQGTLGRQEIVGPPNADTIRHIIGSDIQEIHTFQVERQELERLRLALDEIYRDGLNVAVNAYGMTFVHHPQPYTYWSNSNRMTAAWMKALGCEIRGAAYSCWWRVPSAD